MTADRDYTSLSTGLLKLTVTSSSGTDAPVVGEQAYGLLNIPGVVFLLKPLGSGSQIIPMAASGSCPSVDQNLNWIEMDETVAGSESTTEVAGTYAYDSSAGSFTLPTKRSIDLSVLTPNLTPETITCSAGTGTITDAKMHQTAAGGAIASSVINNFSANIPSNGFFSAEFGAATTEKLICMAQANVSGSGKNFIFCVGDSPDTTEGLGNSDQFNALFISK